MATGRIKVWLDHRGFGFIVTEGSPDIFVHISQVNYRPVQPGDIVTFDLQFDAQSRPRATNVRKVERGTPLSIWEDLPEVRAKKAREIFSEALIARNEKDYKRARKFFEDAISLSPEKNFFDAYAAMEKNLGDWDKVREIYRKARQYHPHDVSILESLAMAERKAGNLERCIEILESALREYPERASLHINFAQVLVDQAEHTGSFEILSEAKEHFTMADQLFRGRLNIKERRHYHKFWILHQRRSRLAWLLFRNVGFKFVKWRVNFPPKANAPSDAWILMDPRQSKFSRPYSLDGLVLLYCHYAQEITESGVRRGEECLKERAAEDPNVKPDLLFIVLPEIEPLKHYLRLLLEDPESHPTVVPIEESKINEILADNNPEALTRYLEQLLSEWIFRRDLYKGNFPVSGRRFFGREREIGILNQSIDEGRSMGIFGLRKSGKTSLLYQLRLIRKGDIVAYVDPEASPISDCSWICWRTVQEWAQQVKADTKSLSLTKVQSEEKLPDWSKILKGFSSDLRTLISKVSPDAKLILMLDEIEKVMPTKGEGWAHSLEFFRFLRGAAQQSQGKLVTIVAGANPAICEMAQWNGEDNPVFQFFEEMFLPLLPENECREMIVTLGEGMGVEWEEEALKIVYRLSGGHPFITRRLCSAIVNRFSERPLRVTSSMVEKAEVELLMEVNELFNEIKERLQRDYPDEWEVLEAIASGFSVSEIKQLVPTYSRALRHLEGYQLIELTEDRPKFKISLLEKWLVEG
ncbi:MAG: hypothetical protein DRH12_13770 [Deltaproteobacteria bacterium]|nr:MAG: hypothetical protein DRH12_13770 [Deltaproteobacteria bacterium]